MRRRGGLVWGGLPGLFATVLRSVGFVSRSSGWQIEPDGTAEFQGVTASALEVSGDSVAFYGGAPAAQQTVAHGNVDAEIGGLTVSGTYQQAEIEALRDKCEELADDVRSLRAALLAVSLVAEA